MNECNDRTMGIEYEISLLDQAVSDLIIDCAKPVYEAQTKPNGGLYLEPFNPNLIRDIEDN